ncbi:MAG TPA: hypothetical protein VF342_11890 [Alphaproteobacteria bacterium]
MAGLRKFVGKLAARLKDRELAAGWLLVFLILAVIGLASFGDAEPGAPVGVVDVSTPRFEVDRPARNNTGLPVAPRATQDFDWDLWRYEDMRARRSEP